MYKLKEAVVYFYEDSKTIIQLGKDRWKISDPDKKFYYFLEHNMFISDISGQEYLDFLLKENLLIEKQLYPKDRFLKNRYYFENLSRNIDNIYQENFFKKKVLIIGLGGIGSVILFNLVAMGVKNFILIDGDNVELTNFNRQIIFEINDVGQSKVRVLKDRLYQLDNSINVEILNEYIVDEKSVNKLNDFHFDMLINAADIPQNLNEILLRKINFKNIDFITGGVGLHTGRFSNVISSNYVSDALKYFGITSNINKIDFPILKASISPTNMLIGSLMSNEILKYWLEHEIFVPKMNFINFMTYGIESENIVHENRS